MLVYPVQTPGQTPAQTPAPDSHAKEARTHAQPQASVFGADVGPLSITVPKEFEGPIRSSENGGVTTGWVARRPGTEGGTLLQVSVIDVGSSLEGITPAQRLEGARHYLLEFVRGIAQGRGNCELGDIEQVSLAGLPGARVRWTGTVGNRDAIGVMYCVLAGSSVISLHTQDLGSAITPAMYTAMAAIEGVRTR
jgi:hypothetical protein